jgi:hypothetical protein
LAAVNDLLGMLGLTKVAWARGDEHVALSADELGNGRVVQAEPGDEVRQVVGELSQVVVAQHRRWERLAQKIALGLRRS